MPNHIRNIVKDIKVPSLASKSIKFVFCSRLANKLVDILAKKPNLLYIIDVSFNDIIFFFLKGQSPG